MKITKEHVEIFNHYGGDGDAFIRIGTEREKEIMNYDLWKCIEDLVQNMTLLKNNSASNKYSEEIKKEIKDKCSNQEVVKMLEMTI